MTSHFFSLIAYALAVSVLFSIFMREGTRERIRFALGLAGSMVGIAVVAGWIMRLAG